MEISAEIEGNFLLIRVKGDLDMHTVPEFKEKISSLMQKNRLDNLILNFNKVKFIDSTGVGAILGKYRSLQEDNGELILVELSDQVERIFELSGVLNLIPVFNSENEIITKLKGGNNIA